jgi:hypothetical protein
MVPPGVLAPAWFSSKISRMSVLGIPIVDPITRLEALQRHRAQYRLITYVRSSAHEAYQPAQHPSSVRLAAHRYHRYSHHSDVTSARPAG